MDIRPPSQLLRKPGAPAMLVMASALTAGGLLLSASGVHAATVTVEISNFAFQPASVTVQVGDTVTWTNLDSAPHTATDTGSQSLFDGVMDPGGSFSYTFTQAGTVSYLCTFHPEMTGTVIVQAASAPGASQLPDGAMPQPGSATTGGSGWGATLLGVALLLVSLLAAVGGARMRRPAGRP